MWQLEVPQMSPSCACAPAAPTGAQDSRPSAPACASISEAATGTAEGPRDTGRAAAKGPRAVPGLGEDEIALIELTLSMLVLN